MKIKLLLIACFLLPLSGCKAVGGLAEIAVELTYKLLVHAFQQTIGNVVTTIWDNIFIEDEISIYKTTRYNEKTHTTETIVQVRSLSQQPLQIQNLNINNGDCHSTLSHSKAFKLQAYGQTQSYQIQDCTFSVVKEVELDTALKHYTQKF